MTLTGLAPDTFTLLNGESITVHKATYDMAEMKGQILGSLLPKRDDPEFSIKQWRILLFASLRACSTGEVPETLDEFRKMFEEDVEAWKDRASKMNPRWFTWLGVATEILTEAMTPELRKKKGKKRHTSTTS